MGKGILNSRIFSKGVIPSTGGGGGGSGDMTKIVYDPAHVSLRVLFETIQISIIEAQVLVGATSQVAGQNYMVVDAGLPTEISAVLITTIPTSETYSTIDIDYNNCLLLTAFGWKKGYYNPTTNQFSIKMNQRFMIEDFGGTTAITVIYDDYTGTSYTISVYSAGEAAYEINSGSDNNWVTGSYKSIYRPHPYYNFNNDPCVGYGSVVSTNKIRVQGLNTALGGILDSDGQLPANNLYIDMENTLTNI